MSVEKLPRTRIELDQAATTKRARRLLQDITTKLTALQDRRRRPASVATWLDTQTVESDDPRRSP